MKILVGCEHSGVVRDAFIAKGHDAISCDLLPTDSPGPHHQGDIHDMLNQEWDLIIMHPECTAVCNAGNRHYGHGSDKYYERISSAYWIMTLWNKCKLVSDRVCFENPPGVLPKMANLPDPQYVQPWWFGHMEQKRTGLYLYRLPELTATHNVYKQMMNLPRHEREAIFYMAPGKDRWKIRSTTYDGIADAFAKQWGIL